MESQVEKMYENAGVKLRKVCTHADCDCDEMLCDECEYFKDNIFAFTVDKQLELLKFCFDKYERLEKVRGLKERCIIYYRFDKNGYTEFVNCETWEETIAGLINNLWQDLTDIEKAQIKEILE